LQKLSIGDHDRYHFDRELFQYIFQANKVMLYSPPTALLESLAFTLDYYNYSTEALETLHETVFHAVQKNKGQSHPVSALD
jgi:hypothetical protein